MLLVSGHFDFSMSSLQPPNQGRELNNSGSRGFNTPVWHRILKVLCSGSSGVMGHHSVPNSPSHGFAPVALASRQGDPSARTSAQPGDLRPWAAQSCPAADTEIVQQKKEDKSKKTSIGMPSVERQP